MLPSVNLFSLRESNDNQMMCADIRAYGKLATELENTLLCKDYELKKNGLVDVESIKLPTGIHPIKIEEYVCVAYIWQPKESMSAEAHGLVVLAHDIPAGVYAMYHYRKNTSRMRK